MLGLAIASSLAIMRSTSEVRFRNGLEILRACLDGLELTNSPISSYMWTNG